MKNIGQKRKHLTDVEIGRINEAADQGESHRSIGKCFKRENSTNSRLVKKYKQNGKTERAVGSGRKPKTSKKEDRYILNAFKKNRKITCSEIKLDLNLTNISKWTISRRIKASSDFFSGKQIKKPFVSEINIKKPVKWCIEHKDWTCEQMG
ncbi:uncharacterized protein LOC124815323 [Hydra vulgaris]|uniref:uncharacterized protein LOC124815323 n=1 Tax=Hydra vulgaris TaxID=6087 RepID=UPI0032E9F34F